MIDLFFLCHAIIQFIAICFIHSFIHSSQQLNDGGKLISEMVKADKELGQSGVDIRVWTGDTMTAASVYQQLIALPDLQQLFYIGANGKIGTAVCQKLVQQGISVRIFSKYEGI